MVISLSHITIADPDPEDPGLFKHPDPDPQRGKHRPKSSDNHTEIF